MNDISGTLQIMGVGILGIALVMLIKINDITQDNANLNFRQVAKLFLNKATASYLASIIALFIYAATRDSWITLFVTGDVSASFVGRLLGLNTVMGFFVGGGMQWGIYKLFLNKVDKIMKAWSEQ
jgi:hypothetical protein